MKMSDLGPPTQTKRPWKKRAFWSWKYIPVERRSSYQWGAILLWSILMFFFFQRYVVGVGIVQDRSMFPTLREGSTYLINKYIYQFTSPKRGDIVLLWPYRYATEQYVKRVIACSGDTLSIKNGHVSINGTFLPEPYTVGLTYPEREPFPIKKGFYFVMGDNRRESEDSRTFGSIPLENIAGKIDVGG